MASKPVEQLDSVVIRFAGDSGDGMQLTGGRFTSETAMLGNDLATYPDFPAEIRAPAGSLPGVSGFQLHFADHDILTPGDAPNVLVAMNPAALKTNLNDLPPSGILVVDSDAFTDRNLTKAGYDGNPIEDGSLEAYEVHAIPLTSMTIEALKEIDGITKREAERAKNMFALGLMSWLYGRPTEGTIAFLESKFAKRPEIAAANVKAFQTGYAFGETTEAFAVQYEVKPAALKPGLYRNITGNQALAYGLIAASVKSGPAALPRRVPDHARIVRARGARAAQELRRAHVPGGGRDRGGRRGARRELRWLTRRVDVERSRHRAEAGDDRARHHARVAARDRRRPTGRPVDGHADEARAGRPARSDVRPQFRVTRPGDRRRDAERLLRRSAGSGAHRDQVPHAGVPALGRLPGERLRALALARRRRDPGDRPPLRGGGDGGEDFQPYRRDEETLARPWAIPGTAGLEHRIGGLEKQDVTGNVSYDPDNHDLMVRLRAQKVAGIAQDIPELEVDDPDAADTLVLSWGGTYGSVAAAVRRVRGGGKQVAHAHLRYLNPFPRNTGEVLRGYEKVLVPEINLGQLQKLVRAEFLVDATGFNLVRGVPFRAGEVADAIDAMVDA